MELKMLADTFYKKILPELQQKLNKKNPLAVPRIEKVVVNMRIGEAKEDKAVIDQASQELALITGQKPKFCQAKKSISGFKLRKGDIIGLKVTLRGRRMYDFLERLFVLTLPRLRDFRGLPLKGFDSSANYTIGLKEQLVFPEIQPDKIKKERGLEVTIVTSTKDRNEAKTLLESMGAIFEKE